MLTLESYNDVEKITRIYNKLSEFMDLKKEGIKPLEEILVSDKEKSNLFITYFSEHVERFKYNEKKRDTNLSSDDVNYTSLLETYYSVDFLEFVLIKSDKYISCDVERIIEKLIPKSKLISVIQNTPWQWYYEDIDSSIVETIYKTLNNLKTPFNDDRFKALPIHVNCYQKGANRSEWLRDEVGGINTYYNKETKEAYQARAESSYYSIVIDAKIGIVLFFKDKPSITLSFNFDNDKNLYIHQVQSQPKDRGHYKIKGDWKIACIQYLQDIFPDFKLHIISGEDLCNLVLDGYNSEHIPESLKPKKETLKRIENGYNNIIPKHHDWFKKGRVNYRELVL